METVEIIKSALDLGLSGVLLYFLLIIWKDRKETVAQKDTKISSKDDELKTLNNNVLEVVKENTKASIQLQTAISANTEASKNLTQYVYDALKK